MLTALVMLSSLLGQNASLDWYALNSQHVIVATMTEMRDIGPKIKSGRLKVLTNLKGRASDLDFLATQVLPYRINFPSVGQTGLFFLSSCSTSANYQRGIEMSFPEMVGPIKKLVSGDHLNCFIGTSDGWLQIDAIEDRQYVKHADWITFPALVQGTPNSDVELSKIVDYLPTVLKPQEIFRNDQEKSILLAVLLYMLSGRSNSSFHTYCIAVSTSSDDGPKPADRHFLSLLDSMLDPPLGPRLTKSSDCKLRMLENNGGPILKDKSGQHALQLSVGGIQWANDKEVLVGGDYYYGPTAAGVSEYQLVLDGNHWTVVSVQQLSVS